MKTLKTLLIILSLFFTYNSYSQQRYSYYDNQQPKELITFNNDVLDGKCFTWDSVGNITAIGNYKHGKKHGNWKIWHANGRLAYSFHYKNGQKTGVWKSFDTNGELICKKEY